MNKKDFVMEVLPIGSITVFTNISKRQHAFFNADLNDKVSNILYGVYTCIVITFITMIVAFVTLKKVNERFNESIH
jgi:ABC-type phosphate transport system permease subunit